MRSRHLSLVVAFFLAGALTGLAQDRPPVSPGISNAVLLATNSIQLDRDVVVESGDVIVNDAAPGAVLGETELSIDSNARTAAGFRIAADGIDLDHGAFVGGDAHYNQLLNDRGTIAGLQFTPLALPVYGALPLAVQRPSGSTNVVVPDFGSVTLAEDSYGSLTVGRNATVTFSGGGYSFSSITADRNSSLLFGAASTVVVNGKVSIGRNSTLGPAAGSGLGAAAIQFYVHGVNATPAEIPAAMNIGQATRVSANLQAYGGTIAFELDGTAAGSFFARDIRVGRSVRITLASATNAPPTANAQTVSTAGAAPLTITLTGSDPEGGALAFSILSGPTAGSLGAITPTSASSATVVYTPSTGGNLNDSFTFRVTDPAGSSGSAVVTINPPLEDEPPTTVIAIDTSGTVFTAVAATINLAGNAPSGVGLTFSIVGSGPAHGTLGAVTQGTESPQRTASVTYTSASGYTGPDSFEFQACGTIGTSTVCDTGTVSLTVVTAPAEPPDLVTDVTVSTAAEDDVVISLSGNSLSESQQTITLKPRAAFLDHAEIAGNVADADENGLGDNHNDLSSGVPVVMSAGVNSTGGAGSNGTKRMQFEWDISSFGTGSQFTSAEVVLTTHRGAIDSLDTFFFWGGLSGDGALTDSDFESDVEPIGGAVMPVPSTTEMPLGSDGTFSFPVLAELRAALAAGHTHLVIQGRVDESVATTARGLEVYTSVAANVTSNKVPMLGLTTPGVLQPTIYSILSLPADGTLFDGTTQITSVPYTLSGSAVRYVPNTGFVGTNSFSFQAELGATVDTALVTVHVFLGNCGINAAHCNDGRD